MREALLRLLRIVGVGAALLLSWTVIGALYTGFVDDIAGTYLTVFGGAASLLYLPLYTVADARRMPVAASGRVQGMAVLYGWLAGLPASVVIIAGLIGLTRLVRF